jgi:hypothetical protein
MTHVLTDLDRAHYHAFGFVVLRAAFDPGPLSDELDRSLLDGLRRSAGTRSGAAGIEFGYLPLMNERTPVSLALLDQLAEPATTLLGASVLPVRAKAVRYAGGAGWHTDSHHQIASIGFAAYLEPLDEHRGALRVVPGSHRSALGLDVDAFLAHEAATGSVDSVPGFPVATAPGDVIAFDEHLYHASSGGRVRRQWRVDFVADPVGPAHEARVRRYFADIFPPDWDGGYDVDRFPTYGPHWRQSGRTWIDRLDQLGVFAAAEAEEAFARSQH